MSRADKLKSRKQCEVCGDVVEVTGFEPATFGPRTKRATSCATPRKQLLLLETEIMILVFLGLSIGEERQIMISGESNF